MMDDKGMLVSPKWLQKVDKTLFHTEGAQEVEPINRSSLYYDIRPAQLASAWTLTGGVYKATAYFITTSGTAETTAYDVYAPTAASNPGGTVGTTRFNIVWRGRWEMIGGGGANYTAGDGISIQGTTISNSGVRSLNVYGEGSKTGSIYFEKTQFNIASLSGDVVGTGIWIDETYIKSLIPAYTVSLTTDTNSFTFSFERGTENDND